MSFEESKVRRHTTLFAICVGLIGAIVWASQYTANARVAAKYSSQTLFVPLLWAYLIWNERKNIFSRIELEFANSTYFVIGAAVSALTSYYFLVAGEVYLFSVFSMVSTILLGVASFVASYGHVALRRASFAFFVLPLAIPFPDFLIDKVISILQIQSASLSAILFSLIGIPVFKQGVFLSVPGVTIEVARECSGINSSIALALTMLLLARESLTSSWRRALLVAASIPLSIIKNAIRITTLTMLAVRVDPSFLTGRLHHHGGFVFYLLAMALIYPFWKWLKRGDSSHSANPGSIIKMELRRAPTSLHSDALN